MANVSVNIPPEMFKIIVFTGVGVAGYFLLRKGVNEIKNSNVNADLDDNGINGQAARLALRYFQAIHENDFFGVSEDEAAILQAARDGRGQNVPFNLVSRKYKNKYRKDLLRDIQNGLSTSEFAEFQNIIAATLGFVQKQKLILLNPSKIYNRTFTKSQHISHVGRVIGSLKETAYLGANEAPYYGFVNNKRLFYIPAKDVNLKTA